MKEIVPTTSIRSRFRLLTLLSGATVLTIVLILVVSLSQLQNKVNRVVEDQILQTVENSQVSRSLAHFLSRLQLFKMTFYGRDSFLEVEGAELQRTLKQLRSEVQGDSLRLLLGQLEECLQNCLRQCAEVNNLLLWRRQLDEDIFEMLSFTEELVAEQIIDAALLGENRSHLDQLVMLLTGYRETMLKIGLLNAAEDYERLQSASFVDLPPRAVELDDFSLRLRTLTASEPPIDRLGRHLIDQVAYYRHLMGRYQHEMIFLGRRSSELKATVSETLSEMTRIDQYSSKMTQRVSSQIEDSIYTVGGIVLIMLTVLTGLLGLAHLNLFTQHIKQPMETIRNRLLRFRQGDLGSPMSLKRNDEWGQIEEVFNEMSADLVESWSALKESERRYRSIFDSASEGIFQSTIEGAFLNINPALARIFGIEDSENLNSLNNLREVIYVNPADRDQMIRRLLEEETIINYEVQMRRFNGEPFRASINCHLVKRQSGKVVFIEGTLEDISKRWLAEEQLRRLKEYLSDIVDTMPSVLIGVSADLEVTLWNRHAIAVCGIEEKQALGQPLVDVFSLIDPALYVDKVKETLQSGRVARLRKILGRKQNQECFFDLLIYPLKSTEPGGVVIHLDDVTEKVQIEEVMVQSEKMLSVGSLAAGIAHEINNPLASVLQNVQVMEQRLSPVLEKNRKTAEELGISIEQVAEYTRLRGFGQMMKSISDAGKRAARIIENMLNFSRKSSSSFLPCSLTDLLDQTIELASSDYDMKHHFDFRSINIVREYQPVPDIPCESSQIQQVIYNLLKNAAQEIGNKIENPEIRVRVFQQNQNVCLQVEDNGNGMEEEICRRIFEPFFTTREVGVGTGLGLSVSYFLITENHKGSLTVKSKPGQGSCFSILLPLKR